ncbi:MAG TPA: class I SAM-dependent methyltransferase [Actinophytocola sp.]|uniref:class I SAM-dependent methyltransferase n=1 Tax=Actinophytocola sp. TaxID=1872138 RepID=UPI002DB9FC92|nr:class I SAM-dependent methyltransferase [Actinophytocola sp.]HEU5471767.1 class I SAM-dependent methyltransferase [Actinophytocola sp.]
MNHQVHVGTRDDPHAQARSARTLPVLLHSMAVFRELFEIIFDSREIRTVVEVGVESGKVSGMYAELGATAVYCVDPKPTDEIRANLAENDALHLVEGWSPDVLADLPVADMYVLDGDHNYAIVHDELAWVMANAPDAVIVLHDVMWPCARRDLYYEPSALGPERRHPASADGPTVWHDELTPAGFVGLGAFTSAERAGGERNGVLTAVEDAVAESPWPDGWRFELVPAVFGMGILVRTTPEADRLLERLRPFTESRLLCILENNRIALYTKVLQMQFEAVAHADDADRLAETVARQRHELAAAATRQANQVLALQLEVDRLRGLLGRRFRPRLAGALRRLARLLRRLGL